jgi:drug/metabolite transporter (DMT)-like permease
MTKQTSKLPIIALTISFSLAGVNTVLIKMGVATIPVPIFLSIRFLAAALLLLPFAVYTWKPLKRKDVLLLVLNSFFYITFSSLALNIGLTKTTASNAAIIWLLAPLLLFILSASFLKERLSLKTFLGIIVALVGSLIIIGRPWEGGANGSVGLTGNLFIVIAAFCQVISTLIAKPLTKKTSAYQLTFMSIFPGIVPVALYALTQLHSWNIHATTAKSIEGLVYGTINIVIVDFLFFYALRYKRAQDTGVYIYLDPIATLVAAWFLLSERPSTVFILGSAFVFLGIYIAEFSHSRKLRLDYSKFRG